MDARPGGTDRHAPASRMRAGVAGAVRAGVKARGLTPAALASFLTAAAFTPLLVPVVGGAGGGEAAAALVQLGGLGGGYLATVLTDIVNRARRSAPGGAARAEERIRAELAEAIRQAIDAPGEAGAGMRSEVSSVLRRVDAIGAAMAADRDNILAPALTELGGRFTEFHWVLGDLGTRLVAFTGRMVVVSGQVPVDGQGRLVGQGDPLAQVRQVFENLSAALAAAGARMDQVVKLTVFLTDLADLGVFRQVRDSYISPGRPPASSLVQVSGLVNPEFRVEIEALAVT